MEISKKFEGVLITERRVELGLRFYQDERMGSKLGKGNSRKLQKCMIFSGEGKKFSMVRTNAVRAPIFWRMDRYVTSF